MEFDDIKAPYEELIFEETKAIVYNFCTLCSLLKNKKLSFQHIFALLLTEENYREFFKSIMNEESDLEIYKAVLAIEPSIASSKYISKLGKMMRKDGDGDTNENIQ